MHCMALVPLRLPASSRILPVRAWALVLNVASCLLQCRHPCLPADRLLVPTPTPRITPPREALGLVRSGLGVQTLPEASARMGCTVVLVVFRGALRRKRCLKGGFVSQFCSGPPLCGHL